MKIFLSWSGDRSRLIAEALRDWLVLVVQAVEPWMSAVDLQPGTRWNTDVARELEASKFGILCMTPENLSAPWLLFEAGALAKTLDQSLVVPYLFDVPFSEVRGPLVQFQGTRADKDDTWKLVRGIYRVSGSRNLTETQLRTTFDKFWPDLQSTLDGIRKISTSAPTPVAPKRTDRDLLEEALQLLRTLRTSAPRPTSINTSIRRIRVRLDLSAVGFGEQELLFTASSTFQSLLDRVFTDYLQNHVPPHTYGKTWVLEDSFAQSIQKEGARDERPLRLMEFTPDEVLKVKLLASQEGAT